MGFGAKSMNKTLLQLTLRAAAALASALCLASLVACATPQAPVAKAVYDLGLPAVPPPVAASAVLPALALADIATGAALDSTAMVYRLSYADVQQLRPYTLARWSMPPAQLLRLRLRDALSARGPVLGAAEGAPAWRLLVELDEFSQWFDAPTQSAAVVRLRATLLRNEQWAAQSTFSARASAPSADAAGGVRAMATAVDDVVQQLGGWSAAQLAKP